MKKTVSSVLNKYWITPRNLVIAGAATAILVACGGGGGSTTNFNSSNDSVSAESANVAAQLGLTTVPGNSATTQAFDLVADIGDTWRLLLNQDGTYAIQVLSTQYGLTNTSGTYTQSVNGNLVVFTAANGSFVLTLDKRTKTISGNVTLGGKAASVAGSGYAAPADTRTLSGDYVYFGSARNASNGGSPDVIGGSFRIAANGTDVSICDKALINANGTCDVISTSPDASTVPTALTLVKNTNDGLTHVKIGTDEFGILNVQAGDRGPVLLIDRFGYNQDTPPVLRTGAIYAVKQKALAGNEANGTWSCVEHGAAAGTVVVNGTSVQTTDVNGHTTSETLYYNKVNNGMNLVTANGFGTSVAQGDPVSDGVIFMPLSSSLGVVERDSTRSTAVCRLKS